MEPPKGGASAEHQLPGADLQDSGGGAFTKKQPQGASRTGPARQGRRSRVGKWLEGRMLWVVEVPCLPRMAASAQRFTCPSIRRKCFSVRSHAEATQRCTMSALRHRVTLCV